MSIRMKELQGLGYLKILKYFPNSFQTEIKEGILKSYKYKTNELDLIKYMLNEGVSEDWALKFLTFVEPLWDVSGSNIGCDVIVRHFKTRWATLWRGYVDAVPGIEYSYRGLMNLGISIARGYAYSDDLQLFYDVNVRWYLLSSVNDAKWLYDMLVKLVTYDCKEFVSCLWEGKL